MSVERESRANFASEFRERALYYCSSVRTIIKDDRRAHYRYYSDNNDILTRFDQAEIFAIPQRAGGSHE